MAKEGFIVRLWRRLFGKTSKPVPLMHPMPKYYLFNETGNILICTSGQRIEGFDVYIKDAFRDVSVFFSAMTKALALHEDGKGEKGYSIYNIKAIETLFTKSGMFVETTTEDGYLVSRKVGETLGKRFVETVLGRNFDDNSLSFTRGMFSGMRKFQESMGANDDTVRSGHVFFICEMLNGLPTTSVVLASIERQSGEKYTEEEREKFHIHDRLQSKLKIEESGIDLFEYGEMQERGWQQKRSEPRTWIYHKRSYIFVPPNFMKNANRLLNASQVEGYDDLVESLSKHLAESL